MTGMTPERLADIRERVEEVRWGYLDKAEADRGDLLNEVDRLRSIVAGVEALHVKHEEYLCGAMAEVPHRHGNEQEPYPIRPVVCTEPKGHDGPHKDAICCWNFQKFTEPTGQKSDEWADRSSCSHCMTTDWPCATAALLDPTEGETDE